jgi:hypothetical protein
MRDYLTFTCIILALATLPACASRPRLGEPGCRVLPAESRAQAVSIAGHASLFDPASTVLSDPSTTVRFLALSGGGSDGAFGAGYLVGAEHNLPNYQIVTGVSAGALLASHAFAGMTKPLIIFNETDQGDIITKKLFPFWLFGTSVYDNKPLWKAMYALFDEPLLKKVAEKSSIETALAVGVVNLDDGSWVTINLGELAKQYVAANNKAEGERIRERYTDAVLSSAAIPLVMPPSYFDCQMMVDGGVRNQLFMIETLDELRALRKVKGEVKNIHVDMIVNGTLKVFLGEEGEPTNAQPNLVDIGGRSIATMINASLNNDVDRICSSDFASNGSIISMDLIAPAALKACRKKNKKTFDGDYLKCVFAEGEALAKSSSGVSCASRGYE